MGTYDPYYPGYYKKPGYREQELRNEITELKQRVAQLENKNTPYEVRLYVNDLWRATFKASDKIRLVEHKYLSKNDDRVLYARH